MRSILASARRFCTIYVGLVGLSPLIASTAFAQGESSDEMYNRITKAAADDYRSGRNITTLSSVKPLRPPTTKNEIEKVKAVLAAGEESRQIQIANLEHSIKIGAGPHGPGDFSPKAVKDNEDWLKRISDSKGKMFQELMYDKLSVGAVGTYSGSTVIQIVDDENMLVNYWNCVPCWFKGFSTKGLIDGDYITDQPSLLIEVTDTKRFRNVGGGTKTVLVVEPFGLDTAAPLIEIPATPKQEPSAPKQAVAAVQTPVTQAGRSSTTPSATITAIPLAGPPAATTPIAAVSAVGGSDLITWLAIAAMAIGITVGTIFYGRRGKVQKAVASKPRPSRPPTRADEWKLFGD